MGNDLETTGQLYSALLFIDSNSSFNKDTQYSLHTISKREKVIHKIKNNLLHVRKS